MPGSRKGLFRYLRNDEPARSMNLLKFPERCPPCLFQPLQPNHMDSGAMV